MLGQVDLSRPDSPPISTAPTTPLGGSLLVVRRAFDRCDRETKILAVQQRVALVHGEGDEITRRGAVAVLMRSISRIPRAA